MIPYILRVKNGNFHTWIRTRKSLSHKWWRHQMQTFSTLVAICLGIHRSPVNSPHKGQWRGALKFSLICVRINGSVNNREAGDLRRYRANYDVTVMTNCNMVHWQAHLKNTNTCIIVMNPITGTKHTPKPLLRTVMWRSDCYSKPDRNAYIYVYV